MNKLLYTIVVLATLTSCAESYSVQGVSSISSLDGSKLYLKAVRDNELKSIDSCEVVHGKFRFAGMLDTVQLANLFMDDKSIMPVVLEQGEISIKIDNAKQTVEGTPMNDKLYEFIDLHNQLSNQMAELVHKENQMLLEGIDENEIREQLSYEAAVISQREDSLVTHFIIDNFDNVLGPSAFMMLTSGYPYPVLTPQIEDIMSKATAKFKSNPYVREYYQVAQENEARQNGLKSAEPVAAAPQPAVAAPLQQDTLLQQSPFTNASEE